MKKKDAKRIANYWLSQCATAGSHCNTPPHPDQILDEFGLQDFQKIAHELNELGIRLKKRAKTIRP